MPHIHPKRKLARFDESENKTDHILIGKPVTPHGDTGFFPRRKTQGKEQNGPL
jgi:hypothetical protein